MSIDQIAATSNANSSRVNQHIKLDQATPAAESGQAAQNAEKTAKTAKTDTVTISAQALKLVSDGDTAAQEFKESAAEHASEKLRGKR